MCGLGGAFEIVVLAKGYGMTDLQHKSHSRFPIHFF